jgi:hypothetical protein
MNTLESNAQSISYGEYKATKSKGFKSEIYSSEINTSNNTEDTSIKFSKILPVKVLPTISNEEFSKIQSGINFDMKNFNTTENFDLKPTPTLDTMQNFENNLQSNENIAETNLDLNSLPITTTTNVETTQAYDASAFQTTESTPSFETNVLQETTNIDTNTYQSSEPIMDIQTSTNTNTFGSEINTNIDINNLETNEPIIDTTGTTTNDNIDLNTFTKTNIEAEATPSFDINALQETTNIDTNAFQTAENVTSENIDLNAFTNTENTETFDINNIQPSELVTNTPLEKGIESTPSFDVNTLNINEANITNLEPQNYDQNNINTDMTNVIDTTSALQTNENFDIKAFETTNTEYQTNNVNIIDATSALQTTTTSNDFDVNAFLNANNNIDTKIDIGSDTNIETNNIFDSTPLQVTANVTNMADTTSITNLENNSSAIPSFDINALTANTEFQSQPTLNIQEYQSISSTTKNYSEIGPNPDAEKKIEFSIVTPLQGKIAKGTEEKEKITAKVTLLPNYGMTTYRPYEGKNNEFNFQEGNKSMFIQSEYKSSTFNPKKGML